MALTPTGHGYWLVASDGGVFSFGSAQFWGSEGDKRINKPVTGVAPVPAAAGYWLVATDGGMFSFGSAQFWGSTRRPHPGTAGGRHGARRPTSEGYWSDATDGGVFTFGDARYFGSMGGKHLNAADGGHGHHADRVPGPLHTLRTRPGAGRVRGGCRAVPGAGPCARAVL